MNNGTPLLFSLEGNLKVGTAATHLGNESKWIIAFRSKQITGSNSTNTWKQ